MTYENCPSGRYHDITVMASPYQDRREGALLSENQVEKCKLCGEMFTYAFNSQMQMVSKAEDRRYFLNHIRDFAQDTRDKDGVPADPAMQAAFEYCKPKLLERFMKEAADQKKSDEFQAEMSEVGRWTMKKALNNEGWTYIGKDGIDRSSSEK